MNKYYGNKNYIAIKAPSDYPGKKYNDLYCYEHQYIAFLKYGRLPTKKELIHHKDGNSKNNIPENLEYISKGNHAHNHGIKKGKNLVIVCCPVCKKIFIKQKRKTHLVRKNRTTCCSRSCSAVISNMKEIRDEMIGLNIIYEFHSGSMM